MAGGGKALLNSLRKLDFETFEKVYSVERFAASVAAIGSHLRDICKEKQADEAAEVVQFLHRSSPET